MSGTSMATPSTTGSCGLIVSYYRRLNAGNDMLASTLKGLVINTADEAGPADGPDYNYGWGQLDTYSACKVIQDAATNTGEIQELVLNNGDTYTCVGVPNGTGPVKATICWTDPPGIEQDLNTTPVLVNDLDLRVTNGGTTYKPWVLDPNNPDAPATTGDNIVDNVEEVTFQPTTDPCTFTVTHKGTLANGSQAFSLILTGVSFGRMTGMSIAPGAIGGGQTAVGTVTLSLPASSAGTKVQLTNSNKAACSVPTTTTVTGGQTTGTFNVVAKMVTAPTSTTITAKYGNVTFTSTLTINPGWLMSLVLTPNPVMGGTTVTGTVTSGRIAGPGGDIVTVSSDNTAVAQVSNWKVVIPEGESTTTFTVTTSPIASTQTVHILAAYPGPTISTALTVTPYVGVSSVSLAPATVIGGGGCTGTVTLSQAAASGGSSVQLTSDNPAAIVPATVVVAAGKKTATFTVKTTPVGQQQTADISAGYQAGTKSSALTILPQPGQSMSLTLSPGSIQGGGSVTGTVTISTPAGPAGVLVKLQSNKNSASPPQSVLIPPGGVQATFTIQTSPVAASTSATISAAAPGRSATTTLQILH